MWICRFPYEFFPGFENSFHARISFDPTNRFCYSSDKPMDTNAILKFNPSRRSLVTAALFFLVTFSIATGEDLAKPQPLAAHPHAFIVQRLTVIFDDKGMAGIRVRWKFDEMFSCLLAEEHDKNRNGTLEADEITDLKKNAFDTIASQSYFTFVRIDGSPFKVKFVTGFAAILADRRLTYEFTVPCHVSAGAHAKRITIGCYDPSYYTAIFFARNNPLKIVGGDSFDIESAIREDPDTSIYFDLIHPWALFLSFRIKE